ncbi:unnamed protein product [Ectocarpus sp. 8 AP-2014]
MIHLLRKDLCPLRTTVWNQRWRETGAFLVLLWYLGHVLDVHASAARVREGDDLEVWVHLRDLLEPLHARAAGLEGVGTQSFWWHVRDDAASARPRVAMVIAAAAATLVVAVHSTTTVSPTAAAAAVICEGAFIPTAGGDAAATNTSLRRRCDTPDDFRLPPNLRR